MSRHHFWLVAAVAAMDLTELVSDLLVPHCFVPGSQNPVHSTAVAALSMTDRHWRSLEGRSSAR
jgi:hypothetical protein